MVTSHSGILSLQITDAVHAQRAYIYLQIFAIGRGADPQWLADRGHPLVSSSDLPLTGKTVAPHPLTVPEIQQYVADHATAAANAITAGFDGVEVHLANGYLVDQFLQDNANKRTDAYGGSVENRARFPLEIVAAVVKAIGASKTGVRISPWSRYQGPSRVLVSRPATHIAIRRHVHAGPQADIFIPRAGTARRAPDPGVRARRGATHRRGGGPPGARIGRGV